MKRLYLDTETTGFWEKRLPLTDPRQPHIVQIATILEDGESPPVEWETIVKLPSDFQMPEAAFRVHGISTEKSQADGMEIEDALEHFFEQLLLADELIAHNLQYDMKLVEIQSARLKDSGFQRELDKAKTYCTMLVATDLCRLPGRYNSYKWPTLDEAYRILVDPAGFSGAHNALADVRACREVYYAIQKRQQQTEAANQT